MGIPVVAAKAPVGSEKVEVVAAAAPVVVRIRAVLASIRLVIGVKASLALRCRQNTRTAHPQQAGGLALLDRKRKGSVLRCRRED